MFFPRMWVGHGVLLVHRITQNLLPPNVQIRPSMVQLLDVHLATGNDVSLWENVTLTYGVSDGQSAVTVRVTSVVVWGQP